MSFELFKPQIEAMKCRYCQGKMILGSHTERVKRPGLSGGKDLNLYDEAIYDIWICTNCSGHIKAGSEISKCRCGRQVVSERYSLSTPDKPVVLALSCGNWEYDTVTCGCTECVECNRCHSVLSGKDIIGRKARGTSGSFSNTYYHSTCFGLSGLCAACGDYLGVLDKWGGRNYHARCASKRSIV